MKVPRAVDITQGTKVSLGILLAIAGIGFPVWNTVSNNSTRISVLEATIEDRITSEDKMMAAVQATLKDLERQVSANGKDLAAILATVDAMRRDGSKP